MCTGMTSGKGREGVKFNRNELVCHSNLQNHTSSGLGEPVVTLRTVPAHYVCYPWREPAVALHTSLVPLLSLGLHPPFPSLSQRKYRSLSTHISLSTLGPHRRANNQQFQS